MEHWPGHGRTQIPDKGKHRLEPGAWQWPHLEYGSVGRATVVSKDGRVRWSTVVDPSRDTRWLPQAKPVKVFPETRAAQTNIHEHSVRKRTKKGLQDIRAYFPDADFPGELVGSALEADAKETRRLSAFDPLLGNLLDVVPSHQDQDEYVVVFPMGELGNQLNKSRFSSDGSGCMVFNARGSPSYVFETPILQITSAVSPSEWVPTPFSILLVRTHTSSSLLRLECPSVTRELDITRSETGDIPIADSRFLASGPDIVVVNRSGTVFKCNTYHGGKAMQLIGVHETAGDDFFWQLGVTRRSDECFLASCKTVKHIDLRSPSSGTSVFSLDHPSTVVTSFESPTSNYISRITTTSDLVWLDDRFRGRPLLSFKHYRSFDRTLRVLTANLCGIPVSLLTSRRNGLVTLYDASRDTDGLLHCNSRPSCLPHGGPMFTVYNGNALVSVPSDVNLTFLRLCQRGSIHRQDIRVAKLDEDPSVSIKEDPVTHQWDEDVLTLEKQASGLQIDFGPAGGRHFTEVNLREIFAIADGARKDMDRSTSENPLERIPDVWKAIEGTAGNMLTMFEVISGIVDGDGLPSPSHSLPGGDINSKQVFDALMAGHPAVQKLADVAQWHYSIQDTSIPAADRQFGTCTALHEHLKELDLVPGLEQHDVAGRRETEAREQLVLDLVLSKEVYSARPFATLHPCAAGGRASNTIALSAGMSCNEEPREVTFGYFRPIRKAGVDYYAETEQAGRQDREVSSPLGVRLLLAEWELGTDPDDYTYRDPYGVADLDTQPVPHYRRMPTVSPAVLKKQVPPQRPPLVVAAAASQPPVVHTALRTPTTAQSQTVEAEPAFDTFSQEPAMNTQVVPGPFGGRPGGKKAAKKRIGGF